MASSSSCAETFTKLRQSKVEPENHALRSITDDLSQQLADTLRAAAVAPNRQKSTFAERTFPPLIIKCAHDSLLDPSSGKPMVPHLITDCTDLCKHLADAIAKTEFQDTERELYVVTAAKATEVAKKARKILEKYVKVVAKAQKKSELAVAKVTKANSKA